MSFSDEPRDPLTGLPKKQEFEALMDAAIENAGMTPVSLAIVDIDHFLAANEKHGHVKGDEIILAIARAIGRELEPEKAQLCRVGGDEIAVIMERMEKEAAFLRLERIRGAIAALDAFAGLEPRPTVSIGVATHPDDGSTRQEIVRKADDALFRAKAAGRNRVGLAREEKMVPKTSHFTQGQLERLSALSSKEGVGEAELLREALDDLFKKYQWQRPTTV
jgi:diguanylate cyclase (GGDEF)-like protein